VSAIRTGPLAGLIGQVALLTALGLTTGLGAAGWLTGVACGVATCVWLQRGLASADRAAWRPADTVTLTRAVLVGGVAALTAQSFGHSVHIGLFATLTAVALALDAVDGYVARRTRTASSLGARFDMEVDAFLILVLSVFVTPQVGAWVLAIGLMRYALGVATAVIPFLRAPVPPRFWRKVVAAVQGVTLAVVAADLLPPALAEFALAAALSLLVESFGRDVWWLWRERAAHTVGPVTPVPSGRSAAGAP